MNCIHGPNFRNDGRVGLTQMLSRELKRFLTELCFVIAVIMMLVQTFPAFSGTMDEMTSICSDDGISIVQMPSDGKAPQKSCRRCNLCVSNCNSIVGIPTKPSNFNLTVSCHKIAQTKLVARLVLLPDHLLPFSGAPPPHNQEDVMQHLISVPEFVSWH